ncbi:MAG: regulatory iron-sulfur-containing complex subunit RicT [Desulfomicrobium sp.]|jgi:cell fate regulator YaaT (PSP1 superfamily)|nr:regulatory iron-sulfur-containing complex subunit RicT [Desulfomicrobium sp.]NLV95781.1 hypothetical protein [Desulfovibrionales bacterium]
MAQYVGVSFKRLGQIYYFLASPFVLSVNDMVLVKTEEGIGFGQIVTLRDTIPPGLDPEAIKPIYRPANQEDMDIGQENHVLAQEAMAFCQECVDRLSLDMKLVEVEIYFDKSKMIFYFTAPGRVDFRELVKELVRTYRTRIELRQIGVRHETQMIGALGNCGQVCCCRRYLRRFETVTIKMAKDQNLFLNPAKISGACGRLLCCLAYEKDSYLDFQNRAPKIGRRYMTAQGPMKTLRTNMFRESVTVLNEVGDEQDFSLDQWHAMLVPDQQPRVVIHEESSMEDIPAELKALQDSDLPGQNKYDKKYGQRNQHTQKRHHKPPHKHPEQKSDLEPQEKKPVHSPKQSQTNEAKSDRATDLPSELRQPSHREKRRKNAVSRKNRTPKATPSQKHGTPK